MNLGRKTDKISPNVSTEQRRVCSRRKNRTQTGYSRYRRQTKRTQRDAYQTFEAEVKGFVAVLTTAKPMGKSLKAIVNNVSFTLDAKADTAS